MGKQKRARQKYHLACTKAQKNENVITPPEAAASNIPLPWNIQPSDNMFSGLDIDFNNLNKSLMNDDDSKSVKSLSKSIKSSSGRLLKKEDKRKLRHNLFIKKIDAIYEQVNQAKKKKKNNKPSDKVENTSTIEYLLNKQPIKLKKFPAVSTKQKGIQKAKQRKEIMLNDVNLFKKILSDPKFVSKPLEHVRASVENKILSAEV